METIKFGLEGLFTIPLIRHRIEFKINITDDGFEIYQSDLSMMISSHQPRMAFQLNY